MKFSAIHQFSLCMAPGDGISNSAFYTQRLLRELGYVSEIYGVDIKESLHDKVAHYEKYQPGKNQMLLVHHGYGHGYCQWFEGIPDCKVLIYHNISPHEFFPSKSMKNDLILGKNQLGLWKEFMVGAISVSDFNKQDLIEAGWKNNNLETIPLLVDIQSIRSHAFNPAIVRANRDTTTLLFVGSLLPHKAQQDLIKSFYYLLQLVEYPVQLILVGGGDDSRTEELRQLTSELGMESSVRLLGKISDEELYGWYRVADLYVSMSEHEGFGMPLVEASIFDIPVIAYDTAGVSDTLGNGGLLFKDKELHQVAALMSILLKDASLREKVQEAQRANLKRFDRCLVKKRLQQFIFSCADSPDGNC